MHNMIFKHAAALTAGALLFLAAPALAQDGQKTAPGHSHDHSHSHAQDRSSSDIHKGYFDDSQIQPRTLADWQGDWQSVYPHLLDGTLDPVMAHKAEHGSRTAAEYRAYYQTGYATAVSRIRISGSTVTFHEDGKTAEASYGSDGHEILTYKAGNRGVRYIFRKTAGDAAAPEFIQFSDHRIAPGSAGHYHLYWGDDRAAVLQELTNWPTYYPSALSGADIASDMMAH